MAQIHPTALVHPGAELADDVQVGPYCIVEDHVKIGPRCVLRNHVIVRRYTTLGEGNVLDAFCVIGGEPQDLKFRPETVSYVRIGDNNVFREGVTINRATGEGNATVIGSGNYWMTAAHAGHNVTIEDNVILVNGSAVGGHATVHRGAILSSHVSVHQFCWVGDLVMSQGNGGVGTHIPPYSLLGFGISCLVGLNTVGLRRASHITAEDRGQIKEAFILTYHSGLTPAKALEKMDACTDWGKPAALYRDFIRRVVMAEKPFRRGLPKLRSRRLSGEEQKE